MVQKLNDEELNNVSGGGCNSYAGLCPVCNTRKSGDWWSAIYTDPTTHKTKKIKMCKKCADKLVQDPNYSNWTFEYTLDDGPAHK